MAETVWKVGTTFSSLARLAKRALFYGVILYGAPIGHGAGQMGKYRVNAEKGAVEGCLWIQNRVQVIEGISNIDLLTSNEDN